VLWVGSGRPPRGPAGCGDSDSGRPVAVFVAVLVDLASANQPRNAVYKGKYVEPRGLEPLTPCLQSDGVDLAEPRSGAVSVGEPSLYSAEQRGRCCTLLLYWFAPSEVPTWERVHPWPWIEDARADARATAPDRHSGFVGSRGGGARYSVPCPAAFQRRGGCRPRPQLGRPALVEVSCQSLPGWAGAKKSVSSCVTRSAAS
jgi:hypothetical protein